MGPLILSPEAWEAIRSHACRAYPRECCGLLLGRRCGEIWNAVGSFPVRNNAPPERKDRYEMEASDRLRGDAEAKAKGIEIVGFYHSHPDHDAYFSATDLANSEEVLLGEPWLPPTYAYLVVSIKKGEVGDKASFYIEKGAAIPLSCQSLSQP